MTLAVGIAAWIIQDGNYGDFAVGQSYRFALEFHPHEVSPATDSDLQIAPSLSSLVGAVHDAVGRVVAITQSAWVVDFGVLAYQEATPPPWAKVGTVLRGSVYIGVDPFFYFEYLKNQRGMPDLFHDWLVTRIQLETTPWVQTTDSRGRKLHVRDDTRTSHVDVSETDAWNADSGHGHYVLECRNLGPLQ